MKAFNILVIGALSATVSVMGQSTNTNDLVRVSVKSVCSSTNQSGGFTNEFLGNQHLIEECAAEMGVTNFTGLSLVYNRTNPSLQVVSGTNRTFLCTALSFEGGVS